ncbi:hypothetical protein [Corallococcus macrosporus]|uniref:Uncharacterized protein n=1 Tax=Myxococcus fulvus (strain ATCC BAA-855 / HW-1) TaxID=483219 RepID=F8C804_MYXFH|nr:hypothetical protein [Corallococcus macrosporus]AEI66956.1 hypothetical protein LILAB_25315 [Corallococcus macrosporus]
MSPTIETAVIALAVSQLLVPLLNELLARRQAKHEAAADQVPLLVQRMESIAADLRDIKAELRMVREHDSELRLVEQRLRTLEAWQGEARPQLAQVANHVHVLMGERSARQLQLQHAANAIVTPDASRTRP